jgi:hypothetical protein
MEVAEFLNRIIFVLQRNANGKRLEKTKEESDSTSRLMGCSSKLPSVIISLNGFRYQDQQQQSE